MDFAQARYYSRQNGRFITVDSLMASAVVTVTQSWNRYSYALNNPLKYTDPTGETYADLAKEQRRVFQSYVDKQNEGRETPLSAEDVYNGLDESQQTTFNSVTHALENSTVTDKKTGESVSALSLVTGVTQITGEQKGKGGKEQFRLLVNFEDKAISKIENSKEFKKDNGFAGIGGGHVYKNGEVKGAKGIRQKGKGAKLQISYLREYKNEADIDVDYRSKINIIAHNKVSNSDIRNGKNLRRHNKRYGKENPLRNIPQKDK